MISAELIAVGSELLSPFRQDTNTLWLTDRLNARGVGVSRKTIIGDDRAALALLFREARRRAALVIACGGLGPTFDDVTREALADALGLELDYHEDIYEGICARYRARRRTPTENNRRQALVPAGGIYFANKVGTAPGLLVRAEGCAYALLPGPPAELRAVFAEMETELLKGIEAEPVFRRALKMVGVPESAVDNSLRDIKLPPGVEWSILAAYGQVELHLRTSGLAERDAKPAMDRTEAEVRKLFGRHIFGSDDDTLEGLVGDLLRGHGHKLALAESCTGGYLAQRITEVPGSSDYFLESLVCYHNDAKVRLLGVAPATLEKHGAVSRQTALEMARGARERSGADVAVSITGVAGPAGGSDEKPVGTVYICTIGPDGSEKNHRLLFPGTREKIRFQATQMALVMIRNMYMGGSFESIYIVDDKG